MVSGLHQKFIFPLSTTKYDNDEEFEIPLLSIKLNSYSGSSLVVQIERYNGPLNPYKQNKVLPFLILFKV